ncbi:hypothetical protein FRC06_002245 [Ceratobasidium sp. 370]|nr:hypothetical protein FRC06_002245 [Ceratobasidium sp. 370]
MDIVTTTFTSFEKDCASIPSPLNSYDPIISARVAKVDIPLWAKIEPPAGKWDLEGAWRNVTPVETTSPPIPTTYPVSPPSTLTSGAIIGIIVGSVFGTALMFIFAAVILWKCLGLGRYRQQRADDVRVGKNMGYLDGEYVYVRPPNPAHGPEGTLGVNMARRFTSRRGAAPPSAWQRLRQIPSALSSPGQPRSSVGSSSDGTSAYHTAQGHTPLGTGVAGAGTPVTEFGNRTTRAGSVLSQVQPGGSQESYHQETDAGVQLVVERGAVGSSEDGRSEPPAYAAQHESVGSQPAAQPPAQPNTSSHGHSEPVSHADLPTDSSRARHAANRVSTLTRDTDWDSTVSSGVLLTWTPARRPTGFFGTGRILSEAPNQIRVVNEAATEQEPRMSDTTSREDALSGSAVNASSTAVSTFEQVEDKLEPAAPDVLSSEGSRETEHPQSGR